MRKRIFVILFLLVCSTTFLFADWGSFFGKEDVKITLDEGMKRSSKLVIRFSDTAKNVDALYKEIYELPITFSPQIKGVFVWESFDKLTFIPDEKWDAKETYSITFSKDFFKKYDLSSDDPQTKNFYIKGSELQRISNFSYRFKNKKTIILNWRGIYDDYIDYDEVLEHLEIKMVEPENKTIKMGVAETQIKNPYVMLLDSEEINILPKNKSYVFECQYKNFKQTLIFRNSYKDLNVKSAYFSADKRANKFFISFSDSIKSSDLIKYLDFKPKVNFEIENFKSDKASTNFWIKGDFKEDFSYVVQISKNLSSIYDIPMKSTYFESIKSHKLQKVLSIITNKEYFPKHNQSELIIEVANIDNIIAEVYQVFPDNIVTFEEVRNLPAKPIFNKKIETKNIDSDYLSLDMKEFYDKKYKGIFKVYIRDADRRYTYQNMEIILTDLNIFFTQDKDYGYGVVTSIDTGLPAKDVQVELYDNYNELIGKEKTDRLGTVRFDLKNLDRQTPTLVKAFKNDGSDFSFLNLQYNRKLNKNYFDIGGERTNTLPYKTFIYSERNLIRPGEKVNLVTLIRNNKGDSPKELPLVYKLVDEQNREVRQFLKNISDFDNGTGELTIDFPNYYITGTYYLQLYIGETMYYSYPIYLEEFMPNQMEAKITTDADSFSDSLKVKFTGRFLFGTPADGNNSELEYSLMKSYKRIKGYEDFDFDDDFNNFSVISHSFGMKKLDANGEREEIIALDFKGPYFMEAQIKGGVFDISGRKVSAYKSVDYKPYEKLIGLKTASRYGVLNEDFPFKVCFVDYDGNPAKPGKVKIELYTLDYDYDYYYNEYTDHYEYSQRHKESNLFTEIVDADSQIFDYKVKLISDNYWWEDYMLRVTDLETGAVISQRIYGNRYNYSNNDMDGDNRDRNTNKIKIDFDKKEYNIGDVAKISIKFPYKGYAVASIEREKIFDIKGKNVEKDGVWQIEFPIKDEYIPNLYVSCRLIRGMNDLGENESVTLLNVETLKVSKASKKIEFDVVAPEKVKPNEENEIRIKVLDKNIKNTLFTIALVDQGICDLKDIKVPDLLGYFYKKRANEISAYDYSGDIQMKKKIANLYSIPGGGMMLKEASMKNLNPISAKRVKSISFWSGILKTDENNEIVYKFTVPQFNGNLKVMIVAINDDRYNSYQSDIKVKDDIIFRNAFPRFFMSGDELSIPFSIINNSSKDISCDFKIDYTGKMKFSEQERRLENIVPDEKKDFDIMISVPKGFAKEKIKFTVYSPELDKTIADSIEIARIDEMPLQSKWRDDEVSDEESIKLESDWYLTDLNNYKTLYLSRYPIKSITSSYMHLVRYPYGCIEQTTSKLFPMLYLEDVAELSENKDNGSKRTANLFKKDQFLQQGIDKICSMQQGDRGFSYWKGGSYVYLWGSLYASHFLIEARKKGEYIPDYNFDNMKRFLKSVAADRYYNDNDYYNYYDYKIKSQVYANYLLTLVEEPDWISLNKLRRKYNDLNFESKALLRASYARAGDIETAEELPLDITEINENIVRETGLSLHSYNRTLALTASSLIDINRNDERIPELLNKFIEKLNYDYISTQELGFFFLALGKYLNENVYKGDIKIVLSNGKTINWTGDKKFFTIRNADLKDASEILFLYNEKSDAKITYSLQTEGYPKEYIFEPVKHDNLEISREFFDKQGNPLSLDNIKQGELVICRVRFHNNGKALKNIVFSQILPSGLEIENPRLRGRESVDWINDYNMIDADYIDIRDDRLNIFFNLYGNHNNQYYFFIMRAVTSGKSTFPPFKFECMYDPSIQVMDDRNNVIIKK